MKFNSLFLIFFIALTSIIDVNGHNLGKESEKYKETIELLESEFEDKFNLHTNFLNAHTEDHLSLQHPTVSFILTLCPLKLDKDTALQYFLTSSLPNAPPIV